MSMKFPRRFQVWLYAVSHAQLLLRSNRSNEFQTRIDVLFKNVAAVALPTRFEGLEVSEASKEEATRFSPQLGSNEIENRKVFAIRGSNYCGYVVAGAVFWHEDDGHHYDPSHFQDSFMASMQP